MKIKVTGCKLVGRNGTDFYFVSSIFDHGSGFRGCTGFVVRPVSAAELNSYSRDDVRDYLDDAGCHEGKTCAEFNRFVDDVIQYDGVDKVFFDESFCCDASEHFDALGIEYECTDCSGCGRIFSASSDYEELFSHAAWIGLRAFEGGNVSFDWAARAIFGDDALRRGQLESVTRELRKVEAEIERRIG
jgi:hypothetical protein